MTKVLHLTRDFPPQTKGGISNSVKGWAEAQHLANHRISVISFDAWRPKSNAATSTSPRKDKTDSGIPVCRVHGPNDLDHAHQFVSEQQPDLIHIHHSMLWDFAANSGLPSVLHIHVLQAKLNTLRGIQSTLSATAQNEAMLSADAVVCPSRAVQQELQEIRPDIRVVGQGINAPKAFKRPDHSPTQIAYVGRFADIKGTGEFIEAMRLAHNDRPGLRICIAGGLPDNRRSEKKWLSQIKAALPDAQFLGWLSSDKITQLYEQSHIVVVPSWYETFGLSALEAMAHGVPVVASDCPALAELIAHNETGVLFPHRDTEALYSAVTELIDYPDKAQELGKRGATEAAKNHAWPACVERLNKVYLELLNKRI